MANINDYKILNKVSGKYFDILENDLNKKILLKKDVEKYRFGFYLYILESICGIKDTHELVKLITDQDFNKTVNSKGDEDHGIDAIFIDEEEKYINIFNFKFREKFNSDQMQSLNESIISLKFIHAIATENTKGLKGEISRNAKLIIDKLNSNEIWKFRLYIISNENKSLSPDLPELSVLKDLYDLEVETFGLDDISQMMSLRPNPVNAVIHIEKDALIPYSENNLASSKSYILRLPANELIRITSNNPSYRDDYKFEDYSTLNQCGMAYEVLFDNVRGFVGKTKFNENIFKTLKKEPSKFFMYNNGLTLVAKDIISDFTNGGKKMKVTINDFQIVNGGQTLRTLHTFKEQAEDNINKYLSNCEILVRVFKTSESIDTKNKIAEFTNSQNSISNIDLKSLSSEQIQIEKFLDEHEIIYARKNGDTGLDTEKKYTHKISMEKMGQILFSVKGFPEKSSNQKKHIFDKYYDSIFKSNDFILENTATWVNRYFEVKSAYEKTKNIEISDQKIFYILYLYEKIDSSVEEKIQFLENGLKNFSNGKKLNEVRKLLQVSFRDYLIDNLKNSTFEVKPNFDLDL